MVDNIVAIVKNYYKYDPKRVAELCIRNHQQLVSKNRKIA